MKKQVLLLFAALLFSQAAFAYDFSAVAPSGQTLRYTILSDSTSVEVVAPASSSYTGNLDIPNNVTYSGTTYQVTSIGQSAFYGCSSLTSVTIPNSVTSIGDYAFRDCTWLTSLTIPNSVTSIGDHAFEGCTGLTSVTIGNSVTSIGSWAFEGCTGLTSVTIGNSVTSIGSWAFGGCTGLVTVTIPNSVTSIGNVAFNGCSGLTSVLFNADSCTSADRAFKNCSNITSFTFGSNVRVIPPYLCYSLTGLDSVTIPNSVTSIGNEAFNGCSGLTSVLFNADSCTSAGSTYSNHAFVNCSNITSFTFGSNVRVIPPYLCYSLTGLTSVTIGNSVTSIGSWAFEGCTGLTSVTIGNSVTSIGHAFYGCTGLTAVHYNGTIGQWCGITFGSYYSNPLMYAHHLYINNAEVTTASIPNTVTEIKPYAFYNCTGLTSVTIPNSVTSIGHDAFYGCTSLMAITIPNSVTSIGHDAFYHCTSLTAITIPNSVTSIDYNTFYGCTSLTAVTIPNSVTSIGHDAFRGCTGLTSVTIGNSVTSIDYNTFYGCTSLTAVTIPNSVTSIGHDAFRGCTGLTSVTIGNSVTSIDYNAFYGCTSLTAITIPNSVTSIGYDAFRGCTGLTSATIGNSVTSIGNGAFYNCTGLTSITIPNSVTSIGYNAFYGCTSLTAITIPNSVTSIGYDAFRGCSGISEIFCKCNVPPTLNCNSNNSGYAFDNIPAYTPVYIPCGRTPYYAAADGWSRFTNFIEEGGSVFSAVSADNNMGSVQILTHPTCTNPQAVIYASANSGYRFDHWSDNSTSNPYTLTVTEDIELIAYFASNGGGEQPSDNAPSIACVGVDMNGHNVVRWEPRQGVAVVRYHIYREGLGGYSQVGYVTATNATEYSWVDDNSNTATQSYRYKLSEVSANGTESDLSQPHTTMHLQISQGQGSTWNLSWTPYMGFNYSGYRIYRGTTSASMSLLTELSSSATTYSDNAPNGDVYYQIEVVSSGAKSITASSRSNIATSVQNQQFTITVLSDNTSTGTVSGGGTFAEGTTATISATPLSGYTFSQWSDGSTQAQRTITVTGNATYTAYFTAGGSQPQQYLITIVSNNPDRGTVSGGGLYDAGSVITITAEPFAGFEFVKWQDGNTEDFRTITVTADATYTAYFRTATEGIDDVEATDNLKIYTRGNTIVIDFNGQQVAGSRQSVVVYDVMGRVIKQSADSGQQTAIEIPVTTAGVYMVKVGDQPSRKVLVRP